MAQICAVSTYNQSGQTVFRCRFDLASVNGIALFAQHGSEVLSNGIRIHREGSSSVLILELSKPVNQLATNTVTGCTRRSDLSCWKRCEDWTPESAATGSTRHVIHGETEELIELVHPCLLENSLLIRFPHRSTILCMSQSNHIKTLIKQSATNTLAHYHEQLVNDPECARSRISSELVSNNTSNGTTIHATKRSKSDKPCFAQMPIPEAQLRAFDLFSKQMLSNSSTFEDTMKENLIKKIQEEGEEGGTIIM